VCKSHRPVHGFVGISSGELDMAKVPKSLTGLPSLRRVRAGDITPDPEITLLTQPATTRLDWVGRNHGKKIMVNGRDMRKTNFLYVDGHVETKTIYETIDPQFQWGEEFSSLIPGRDIQK